MKTTTSHLKEIVMQGVFTACACISILAVALICIFLFANGLPTIFEIGPLKFLLGTTWKPGNNLYGCNLVRRTEKGRLRRRGWGLRWEKAQKGGKGTNLRGFFED